MARAAHRGLLGEGGCAVREPEHRYATEIFWNEEDGCFVACVPDLENCAAWGMSYEEALAQAHVAIRADLESRRVLGEPVPEPTLRYLPEQAIG
jgi:predicted RNase H-like HicB family nuclease